MSICKHAHGVPGSLWRCISKKLNFCSRGILYSYFLLCQATVMFSSAPCAPLFGNLAVPNLLVALSFTARRRSGRLSDAPGRFLSICSCSLPAVLTAPTITHLRIALGQFNAVMFPLDLRNVWRARFMRARSASLIWRVTSNSKFSSFGWLRVPHQVFSTSCQCCAYRSLLRQRWTRFAFRNSQSGTVK